ncbi:MAG: hypothetical protein AAFU67_00320 [Bacteroidota bacterium]
MKILKGFTLPFRSTNFTLQSILPLLLAIGALVDFPEQLTREIVTFIEGAVLAIIGFWGSIREWIMRGIKFRYTGNVLTYIVAFLGGVIEWISQYDLEGVIGQFISALTSGDINLIFPAAFAFINILIRIFRDKPWEEATNSAT